MSDLTTQPLVANRSALPGPEAMWDEGAKDSRATESKMTVLLPSMQTGMLYKTEPDGKRIYLNASRTKLLCPHGECSSTIKHWVNMEARAKELGEAPPPRGGSRGLSKCDCQDTLGLNPKSIDVSICQPADEPASLFELLEQMDTDCLTIKGQPARHIPYMPGPMYCTARGKLCCAHGHSRASIKKGQKATHVSNRLPKCACNLGVMPVRSGCVKRKLPIGKWRREVAV